MKPRLSRSSGYGDAVRAERKEDRTDIPRPVGSHAAWALRNGISRQTSATSSTDYYAALDRELSAAAITHNARVAADNTNKESK